MTEADADNPVSKQATGPDRKADAAKPAFKGAGKRAARESDWSRRVTYDGVQCDVLPPVKIAMGDAVMCKFSPTATVDENIAAHDKHTKRMRLNLMTAVVLLSQTVEGRRNLQTLKDEGYTVTFDTHSCARQKAFGLCRFASKEILLSENIDSIARLALVLNHEAAHARLGTRIVPDSTIRLDDQMLVLNVHEAHARASEFKVALEIMVGHPAGPKSQLVTNSLIKDIRARYPAIAKTVIATAARAGSVHDGQVMADAFIGYFSQGKLRTDYEKRHVGWLGDLEVAVLKHKKTHRAKVDPKKLKSMLLDGNVPYLDRHRPNVDLSAPRYSGVSDAHHKAFRDAWKRFMRHAPLNTVFPPTIAVYPPVPRRGFIAAVKAALAGRKSGQEKKPAPSPGSKPK